VPSMRRERKNKSHRALALSSSSSFRPMMISSSASSSSSSLNSSSNSFSYDDGDLSGDDDSDEMLNSSSSSPEQPESPEDSPILLQTRLPQAPQLLPLLQHQQYLHEMQYQQAIQQTLINPHDGNYWEWSGIPSQHINVHTANASLPVAMNTMNTLSVSGMFNPEYPSVYHAQSKRALTPPSVELHSNTLPHDFHYGYENSHIQNLNDEYSPVTIEGTYGMNFLNMDMPGYSLPLEM